VRLEVVTSNTRALDLYRRNGFVDDRADGARLTMVHAGPTARFLAELNTDIWQPYRQAHASGDTEAFLALHTPELVRAGGPGKTVQGFDEYAALSREWRAGMVERGSKVAIEFRFTERITDGEPASERGVYRLTATRADGDQKIFHGHFHTFARKIYGRWRIAVDYDNTNATPPPPPRTSRRSSTADRRHQQIHCGGERPESPEVPPAHDQVAPRPNLYCAETCMGSRFLVR
jgi:ketosteroid isomerase-like protein